MYFFEIRYLYTIFLITLFLFASSSQAQQDIKYQVEIITFQYLGVDTSKGEVFDTYLIEDYLPRPTFDIDKYNVLRENVSYVTLSSLSETLEKLQSDKDYRVLNYSSWIQPLLNKKQAIKVPLGFGEYSARDSLGTRTRFAPQITGNITVYGDYLLFIDLDLRAVIPEQGFSSNFYPDTNATNLEDSNPPAGTVFGFNNTLPQTTPISSPFRTYKLSEKRRIKLDEFHYFDHPYIGAISYVTRHQETDSQ